ncbi:hypothetical protein [Prevotella sp. E13-27]|uniref:hypothetical protein n=1 Tax=Prevotella sp. E13-27 TaxID=2938122 RepID=UPI00200A57D8|nr:hypothetical protein [Prevotella sp. E13-27]MCK8623454.1 hypothetical protein [Prevotella sp. E13-27]
MLIVLLSTIVAQGQIRIGGNVYGGGNQAMVKGSTSVTVKAGDIGAVLDAQATRPLTDPKGRVFGGARMANVGGNAFVNIDGKNATDYILINQVYGGNDISGRIGTGTVPTLLEAVLKGAETKETYPNKNAIDNTFNSFVRISTKVLMDNGDTVKYSQEEVDLASTDLDNAAYGKTPGVDAKPDPTAKKIYIGQLFGGGNGDFKYLDENGDSLRDNDDYVVKEGDSIIARSKVPFVLPELNKTYLEINGGSIVYGYGGGNNATVKEETVIHFNNPSAVVNHIWTIAAGVEVAEGTTGAIDLLTNARFKEMGINTTFSQPSSGAYQVGRFFGGNNKAEMHIRPTWNLLAGKVRNLYSGGNRGAMTSPTGLLLEIKDYSSLIVDNLYGGCRMADVKPTVNGEYSPCTNLPGYNFPNELSARTLVRGGYVHNVYGGNDVTGTVYGGNAVGIYTNVYGNVYGGGNGAYPYTDLISEDNETYGETYGDFHYNVTTGRSVDALNAFRPNAEQVSIRLKGKAANDQTIIHGSVFVGGNCASLHVKKKNPLIELKMGSHVVVDNVYLGNNGEGMIDTAFLNRYADDNYSTLNLTNAATFAEYMEGVAMTQQPRIVFDNVANGDPDNYVDFSSYVGSFFCGGNVGSMAIPGKMSITIDKGLNIYNKFVGGCNNADITAQEGLNAFYEGGIIGSKDERGDIVENTNYYTDDGTESGNIKDRLEINFQNMVIMPLRWNETFENVFTKNGNVATKLTAGKEYYHTDLRSTKFVADGTETADATHTYYELTKIGNALEWNTAKWSIPEDNFIRVANGSSVDEDTRLIEGNVYGGCYNSGHVNGNIVLNINEDVLKREDIFGTGTSELFGHEKSHVKFDDQRDDVMAVALSVFSAGHGEKTEVWGSTTANLNKGYTLQIFGGGEQGVVGKRLHAENGTPIVDGEGNYSYEFDPRYSTTVNLKGITTVNSKDEKVENLAEAEYLYGGGNEGDVCGNTLVNLGNGRIYDAFGGASDADILGHAEVYIGRQPTNTGGYNDAFPFIRDIVYGGNDFGGEISGEYEDGYNFTQRVKNYATDKAQIHGYKDDEIPEVLKSSTYVEYLQGRVDTIFGGGYGSYNYNNTALYGTDAAMPKQHSSFVNVRPKDHAHNALKAVFGGGTGYPGNRDDDKAQDCSYVLIDIPDGDSKFKAMEVFGAGSYNGLGMRQEKTKTFAPGFDRDSISSIIDLLHGQIAAAYGGSYNEGVTARTVVNVPAESTIKINNIFGGAYGTQILPPCDVIQAIVNYNNTSEKASVSKIYGGNNNERRSLFTQVNISSPVWSDKSKGYLATVYGAGHGIDTWSEHTLVNLNKGAKVYEVYGGGEMGHVLNAESIQKYMQLYKDKPSAQISKQDTKWRDPARWDGEVGKGTIKTTKLHEGDTKTIKEEWDEDWKDAWKLGNYYEPNAEFNNYFEAFAGLRNTSLVYHADIDDRNFSAFSDDEKAKRQFIYSTNVIINEGAEVVNYAYGGGYGSSDEERSGDVYGHTYIALLGGTVKKDIYAAGTAGAVNDVFHVGRYNGDSESKNYNPYGFTASATAYIKGGTCRNVYGGGWEGNVGHHTGGISASPASDVPAETHVVIGDLAGSSFVNGIPAVQRNVYGGGEGGAVFGTAYLTMNNGYVGYQYNSTGSDDATTKDFDEHYEEKIEDDTKETPNTLLTDAGCLFGGGYIDNSTVDKTYVTINGGNVRNSVFGGGEIAAIGRGDMNEKTGGTDYELKGIYRPGKTNVKMYSGHVHRNVYGGGRGYDNLNRHGSLHSDGYIFGQTEVSIHGGEIGTVSGVADGDGNVFGGGDVGFVYSAYEKADGSFGKGVKEGVRYDGLYQGYYYKYENGAYVTENIYYTAEEAEAYNTEHSLNEGDEGFKTTSDVKKTERQFTEDCKVLVEPQCKVISALDIDGTTFSVGKYVPIEKLNKLENKNTDKAKWDCLDQTGIIIHNAVFAGGNANSGSMTSGANTNTVFGNATASINDVFHRDMITLGTRHTGGLYGDGNLTLVDGYRELNITNYGTDYYSIAKEIDINTYHNLPDREAAYYELNYTCMAECQDKNNTVYHPANPSVPSSKAATITADDMLDLFLVYDEVNKEYKSFEYGGKAVLQWNTPQERWEPNPDAGYWVESGVLPVYAGRLMNSIQRADFCGVFGSRMVMQGAQDRVPEEVDYTNYTVNRVREVSLNKNYSVITSDLTLKEGATPAAKVEDQNIDDFANPNKAIHGNYFGIYNVVNYLGALTSDVHFSDVRKTDNDSNDELYKKAIDGGAYGTATFYDWKKENIKNKTRNNGTSHNKVALASGVYLEITTEKSTGTDLHEKDWGPITGVVELDLINVSPGIGGGFVYAKNVHGIPSLSGAKNTTLTALNQDAVTQWDYTYDTTDDADHQKEWESSGNFVHSTQTIIDDCYNVSNRYYGTDKMPAHFWYIKGSTYVYDQYISAYTGQSNAFSEVVDIPLTIAAASHGKMKLLNVMPNRYAYYAKPGVELGDGKKMIVNGKTYYKNDPISYWDWYLLSNYEKDLFVQKTYTNCITCKIDGTEYAAGTYVMTDTEFATYKITPPEGKTKHEYTDADNQPIKDADDKVVGDDYIFRESNNVSHDKGYILTYEVNNPSQWDNWYTPKSDATAGGKITLAAYNAIETASDKAKYEDGPTYRLNTSDGAVLGQSEYKYGDLIPEDIYTTYEGIKSHVTASNGTQATFVKAYIVKNKITVTEGVHETYYNPGTAVSATFAGSHSTDCEEAYICTKSIELTKEKVIYKGSKMKKSEAEDYVTDVNGKMNTIKTGASDMTTEAIKALATTGEGAITAEKKKELISLATLRDDLKNCLVQAYLCTSEPTVDSEGDPVHYYYGGNYYESGCNYRALEAWSSMSATDRAKFDFNYDVLDLLIDKNYTTAASGAKSEGHKYQYDSADGNLEGATANKAHYSLETSVDYTAEYNSASPSSTLTNSVTVKHSNGTTQSGVTELTKGDELSREEFEGKLVNEQRHYSTIAVKEAGTYYVVNTPFQIGSTPYAIGETISSETYTSLTTTEQGYVTRLTFGESDKNTNFYYCREAYTITTGNKVKSIKGTYNNEYANGATVPIGAIIAADNSGDFIGYTKLVNEQKNFTIHGISPKETSTLYVSRESNIYDLSKEKIITVIYQYDYDETDTQGNVTPVSERHVLNIHLTFKSGVPTIENITPPEIILPGDRVSLRQPTVTPGAYEVTGGGWELFATQRDAESHTNGVDYNPDFNQLYWYQDNYYVAYYAKSYLGRTYSNAVPVSVANYHDLKKVMDDAEHHYYIDHMNVQRDSKIYINDYSKSDQNGLDLFKNLYDLSLLKTPAESGALTGHALLNEKVKGGKDLEFFMRTDIDHSSSSWTPIGSEDNPETPEVNEEQCFEGTLHGDGHTISGLDNSLFKNLCGNVYNLGVTGSFNTAGVVDMGTGYVESTWVNTTGTPDGSVRAVFGNPSAGSGYKQVVNSYCQTDKGYSTTDTDNHGLATAKPDRAFYNGEVAYDLNNFYLYKRYNDQKVNSGVEYKYWKAGEAEPQTAYYAENADLCSSGYNGIKYVEDRFADGDYRFAAGVIPEDEDERCHEKSITVEGVPTTTIDFYPIWPDDYIFFGQKLTYGWAAEAHQNVPTAVARNGGRLSTGDDANRVYRAPAYYRSMEMGIAHFNPAAYLAQQEKLSDEQIEANEKAVADNLPEKVVTPRDAYPNMTAIDFKGHYDGNDGAYTAYGAYHKGNEGGLFYTPLLDDDGLLSIENCDETQNLVVYAPASDVNEKTYTVLNSYFTEPDYSEHYDNSKGYRLVTEASAASVHGHLVQSNKQTTNDHLLVDYQDFNAPIAYKLGGDYRMWYQRLPLDKEYVDLTKGWQGISVPFTAELVTTDQKGEITHFYNDGGENSKGHEYWLREFNSIEKKTIDETTVAYADFLYPTAAGEDKNVTNTFLWDYYYENTAVHDQKDKNADEYQEYYSNSRTYNSYPLLTKATPYILGLPGSTYYEFDLSGNFEAKNTAVSIPKLGKQIISFVSQPGISIGVSDNEMTGKMITYGDNDYIFKPSYMNESLAVDEGNYALNANGDSYDKVTGSAKSVGAFRPYFTSQVHPTSSRKYMPERIVFSGDHHGLEEEPQSTLDGSLSIYVKNHKIITTSHLKEPVTICIRNVSGIAIANYVLQPGETQETRVKYTGVYIVNKKKIIVK